MEEWKKIISEDGKLMYEGFTKDGKPFGSGTSYYANGNKCQEGIFGAKGFLYGRVYYQSGIVRFEGAYRHNKGYGPNYPVFGSCYDEEGNEIYYGELAVRKSGMGMPSIVKPECYGPIEPDGQPDFNTLKWSDKTNMSYGKYYVKVRGRKARRCFIEILEKNGFKSDEADADGREGTITSRLPITVDIDHKAYSHMGNTTCAAAAAATNLLISADEFLLRYEIISPIFIV